MIPESIRRLMDEAIKACEDDSDLQSIMVVPHWHPRIWSIPPPTAYWVCSEGGVLNPDINTLLDALNRIHQVTGSLAEQLEQRLLHMSTRASAMRRDLSVHVELPVQDQPNNADDSSPNTD